MSFTDHLIDPKKKDKAWILEYFKKAFHSAITNDYTKVTFIHGVGNGVLKSAIIKELEDYEGIENRMASISKFGVGAIDILIKDND